jgi:3-phosphoglycerate kinase
MKKQRTFPLRVDPNTPASESRVQSLIRMEAAQKGLRLWRNNVGVLLDEHGRPVRYGLANDSKALNEVLKSADLIGWETRLITPEMVGTVVAVFLSVETKREDWSAAADKSERFKAQQAWADMVNAAGGRALFANEPGSL